MFEFEQPKAGFYALKGCKMQGFSGSGNDEDKENINNRARGKS